MLFLVGSVTCEAACIHNCQHVGALESETGWNVNPSLLRFPVMPQAVLMHLPRCICGITNRTQSFYWKLPLYAASW